MIYLYFSVRNQRVNRCDTYAIPHKTRNVVYASFEFSDEWSGVAPFAIFSRGDTHLEQPILNGECLIPAEMTADVGQFTVSVYGGDLITTVSAIVNVVESGYINAEPPEPPEPTADYVLTVDGKIHYIREREQNFEYSLDGTEWKKIQGGGGGGDYPPTGGVPLSDLSQSVQNSLNKADTALQTETDPTVPSWAKQPNKPTYTATEVGAASSAELNAIADDVAELDNRVATLENTEPTERFNVMFLARQNNQAVIVHDMPTESQTILPMTYFPVEPGSWYDILTMYASPEIADTEMEFVTGSAFTAKLYMRSDIAKTNAQIRITAYDMTDGAVLASATTITDLPNNVPTPIPVTFEDIHQQLRIVHLSDLRVVISLNVALYGAQLSIVSNVPDEMCYIVHNSITQTRTHWGEITGDITQQTDLMDLIDAKIAYALANGGL